MEVMGIVFPDDLSGLIPVLWFLVHKCFLLFSRFMFLFVYFNYKGDLFV